MTPFVVTSALAPLAAQGDCHVGHAKQEKRGGFPGNLALGALIERMLQDRRKLLQRFNRFHSPDGGRRAIGDPMRILRVLQIGGAAAEEEHSEDIKCKAKE